MVIILRIWRIHPSYLDQKGLCGQWFEGIIAKNSLEDPDSRWYNIANSNFDDRLQAIDYLVPIHQEARKRGYNFNMKHLEIWSPNIYPRIPVTWDELLEEMKILLKRVEKRDPKWFRKIDAMLYRDNDLVAAHPLYKVI